MKTKILHVVYQCTPNISGSSTRTKQILEAQCDVGFTPIVISSPCQEPVSSNKSRGVEVINNIKYFRTYCFKGLSVGGITSSVQKLKKILAFPYFVYKLFCCCREEKPAILHAHAMFYCAISSLIVGKLLNIPTIYEIRSIWYVNSNSKQFSLLKKAAILLERFAIKRSDLVIAISEGIKSQFSDIRNDIVIVRNAIQKYELAPPIDETITFKRFGYIGSVIELEGLEYAIDAFASLKNTYPDIQFHVYGGGSKLDELKKYSETIGSPTIFHGRVDPSEIHTCYEGLDCIINCRNDEPIAQLVTPLKPLEAIAFNKVLICSNVDGYMEIIGGKENAIIVQPRNISSIISAVEYVLDNVNHGEIVKKITRSKSFIIENRTWNSNMIIHAEIYNKLALSKD